MLQAVYECHIVNSYTYKLHLWLALRQHVFTGVGWQVTLCDPIWKVTLPSSERVSLRALLFIT